MIMTSLCETFDVKHEIISKELASEDDIRGEDDSAIKKSDGMISVKEEDKDTDAIDKYVGTFVEVTGTVKEEKFEICEVLGTNDEARDNIDGIKDEMGEISEDGMLEPGLELATCDQVSSNEVTESGTMDDESSSPSLTDKPAGILELIAKLEDITDNM
jgi:hypothetical protein